MLQLYINKNIWNVACLHTMFAVKGWTESTPAMGKFEVKNPMCWIYKNVHFLR